MKDKSITENEFKETEIGLIPNDWADGEIFVKSIKKFIDEEKFLLEKDLNERTISYKLAEYLQKAFSDYDVDCEYNRMTDKYNPKGYVKKILELNSEKVESDDERAITVYPDIVVHKRGDNDSNHLVIELKKREYAEQKRGAGETYKQFDFKKLAAYTDKFKLNYKMGVYIEFAKERISDLKFFKNGKLFNETNNKF
ncbi:hypothetical protein KKC91_04080 [bacterium]|nr:hypothetical protein [bacterium]